MKPSKTSRAILDAEIARIRREHGPLPDIEPSPASLAAFRQYLAQHDIVVKKLEASVRRAARSQR